jgi:hypothetical protein
MFFVQLRIAGAHEPASVREVTCVRRSRVLDSSSLRHRRTSSSTKHGAFARDARAPLSNADDMGVLAIVSTQLLACAPGMPRAAATIAALHSRHAPRRDEPGECYGGVFEGRSTRLKQSMLERNHRLEAVEEVGASILHRS